MKPAKLTIVFIILNATLFLAKLLVGWKFNSLAVLSDAGNSFVDIATCLAIYFAVKISAKPADADHPFGHSRAEPLAAFTVSILTFVLATEVIRDAVGRLIDGSTPEMGFIPMLVLLGVIVTKSGMYLAASFSFRKTRSEAMQAIATDAKMDVVISSLAIASVFGVNFGYPQLDAYAALFIAVWIGFVGWQIGKSNFDKLLGQVPDEKIMKVIRMKLNALKKQKRIRNFHDLRAHYVGSEIHLSVHVDTDESVSPHDLHRLEKDIQARLKNTKGVSQVMVHIDLA